VADENEILIKCYNQFHEGSAHPPPPRSAGVTERQAAVQRHGYHALAVTHVVRETEDARSFVVEVPDDLRQTFNYRAGQFCSFRVHIGEVELARCYSMSSAPETDGDLAFTVKRVPGGGVSNWLVDHVTDGTRVEVNPPSGNFCVREGGRPIVAFCGGSGITPVISIAKSVLATATRPVSLLYANRDRDSVIFGGRLEELRGAHPGRLDVRHHLDLEAGFVDPAVVASFVDGRLNADFYICGPGPFMDLVEATLLDLGVEPDAIAIERFETVVDPEPAAPSETDRAGVPESIVLILRGKRHEIGYHAGDTVLEAARRADVPTPYSCEAGSCATCMAFVQEGAVTMRVNDALTPEEVDEGWVLTCQSRPSGPSLTVEFEPL
jgi:3-ketosteroid 9alpha-monooxygenase subunit B